MSHLASFVGLLHAGERTLADSLRQVAHGHAADSDVYYVCQLLAELSDEHVQMLGPLVHRYGTRRAREPERLHAAGLRGTRPGPVGLVRDLQDLHVLATLVHTSWTVVYQAAQAIRDRYLLSVAEHCRVGTDRQLAWLLTKIRQAAPQALLTAP